ncbi:arylsulfotransferase family protein [Streptomyces sp. 6N223]|uniref:arylsulfotransferase family protein n=1 Tax=Streptomyces sp. 6N223 TaxID=3457412 RepID=UPI003FD2676D
MRLLRTSVLLRRSATALAGAALLAPLALASTAGAAGRQAGPALVPLAAPEPGAFVTQPGPLQAPTLTTTTTGQEDPGQLLATPGNAGTGFGVAAIYDNSGQVIWQWEGNFYNLEAITYQGQPALVLYDTGRGAHVVLDQAYSEIATIAMKNGQPTDGHDIEFSPDGSRVLVQGWARTQTDLSPWGGSASATVLNPVIQEQVVGTGEVTFEWSALDHVSPDETTESLTSGFGDLFHSNSLEYDEDGDILVSFRNTSTVYKIDIATGDIVWRFGGEQSDFTFAGGTADMPSYQHDARRLPDGSLSVFDNGNSRSPQESRGATYTLDESSMTATLTQELRADPAAYSPFIGNNRQVDNGNQLVSYGTTGRMVEFSGTEQVFTGAFASGWSSYRTERADWSATPAAPPDVVVGEAGEDGGRTLHVSWNGATEVDGWRVEAGPSQEELTPLGVTPKTGFETAAEVFAPEDADVFRVTALDATGDPLGSGVLNAS